MFPNSGVGIRMQQQGSTPSVRTIAVTGASGYIGRAVLARLIDAGIPAVALSRSSGTLNGAWRHYDLAEPLPEHALDGVDAVIHLAAETNRGPFADIQKELGALDRLLTACKARGVRLVFVSSQAAQEAAPTNYGRAKWQCEQHALQAGAIVVRPGQVYGGAESGLFGTLCKLVKVSPVVPGFLPDPRIQPVHVDDLAQGLMTCATNLDLPCGIYRIAENEPIGFSAFLQRLADVRFGRITFRLPVPLGVFFLLLRFPFLPRSVAGTIQRLQSLATLPLMDTTASLHALALELRPLRIGLTRSGFGERSSLIAEASALLRYIVRGPAPASCIKHYVRAVESLYHGNPLLIRPMFRHWPCLLAIVDQPLLRRRDDDGAFRQRLDLATICAESSPTLARCFLNINDAGRLGRILSMTMTLGFEAVRLIAGGLLGFMLKSLRPALEGERQA